jgi:hypothetical protein
MRAYIQILILLFIALQSGCSSIKYKESISKNLPELGVIGQHPNQLLDSKFEYKTVASIANPVRLNIEEIKVEKRIFFNKNDSVTKEPLDSILLSINILDKVSLIKQINENSELIKFLEKSDESELVTEVIVSFPSLILNKFRTSDEVYLVQNKEKTLSLELRKNNKKKEIIEFSQGKITSFKALEFCWGINKRRKVEVFDLVPNNYNCSQDTYRSAKIAKKKNEFKF